VSSERVQRILHGYELFNRGELDEALVGLSEDIEWLAPDMVPDPGPYRGPEGVRRFWEAWHETFRDFRIEIDEVHDLDEHVVVIARVHGIGRDSGAEVTTPDFPHVWTWSGERIVRMQMFPSEQAAREAIGKDWR
jgi:ketosteroid isomerase-like protein